MTEKSCGIRAIGDIVNDTEGKALYMYVVAQDITDFVLVEKELTAAKQAAEKSTKSKSDFLANMSHEIRTPMNAFIGISHFALKIDLTPKQLDYIKNIQSSSQALLGIINDILDFSKIEVGKLEMETIEFDLEDVLLNLSNLISIKTDEKGLGLLFRTSQDVPMNLVGDSMRLGQVLINLANNTGTNTSDAVCNH